jgi:hypothetical protein
MTVQVQSLSSFKWVHRAGKRCTQWHHRFSQNLLFMMNRRTWDLPDLQKNSSLAPVPTCFKAKKCTRPLSVALQRYCAPQHIIWKCFHAHYSQPVPVLVLSPLNLCLLPPVCTAESKAAVVDGAHGTVSTTSPSVVAAQRHSCFSTGRYIRRFYSSSWCCAGAHISGGAW